MDAIGDELERGMGLQAAGRYAEAERIFRSVLEKHPEHPGTMALIGMVAAQVGRYEEAVGWITRAMAIRPGTAGMWFNLGECNRRWGKLQEAVAAFEKAVGMQRNFSEAYGNMAMALEDLGRHEDALLNYRKAIAIKPGNAEGFYNMGVLLKNCGQLDEAEAAYRQAVKLKQDYAAAWHNLGVTLNALGRVSEGVACHQKAMELEPENAGFAGNWLYALQWASEDNAGLLEEHRKWDRQFATKVAEHASFANERDPERRLRIGYVSGDFRQHSVAYFLMPLLEKHDREKFHVTCYSNHGRGDAVTERIKGAVEEWREILGISDEEAARRIREDGIDILVDLSGHTAAGRAMLFARRAAPVQVSYLGYAGSMGMSAIDYRLSDALADPEGDDEGGPERLLRLEKTAWCYSTLGANGSVGELPAKSRGGVTFGTFSNFAKVNEKTMELWGRILRDVPASRLFIKNIAMRSESAKKRAREFFAQRGIAAERLELVGWDLAMDDHLAGYGKMDVALDTYPYHGTTTTCEALWMGVPVVTLAGRRHASRVGVSLLTNVGLPELIAESEDDYVRIATSLAKDADRLAKLRAGLRERMEHSVLMDGPRMARQIEAAYQQIWRTWLTSSAAHP